MSEQPYYCTGVDKGVIGDEGKCLACGLPPLPPGYENVEQGSAVHIYEGLSVEDIIVGSAHFVGMALAAASDSQLREWVARCSGPVRRNEMGLDGRALARRMTEAEIAHRGGKG